MSNYSAVFLDRDGTLIRDVGYPRNAADVELLPGVVESLTLLRNLDLALVVVSNQSGVGRGLLTSNELKKVHERLCNLLAQRGIQLDGAYYCPHTPWDHCECRKPRPGLLHKAAQNHQLDLSQSFMVGDKLGDVVAGHRAGCRSILLGEHVEANVKFSFDPLSVPDVVTPNLFMAARWIEAELGNNVGDYEYSLDD